MGILLYISLAIFSINIHTQHNLSPQTRYSENSKIVYAYSRYPLEKKNKKKRILFFSNAESNCKGTDSPCKIVASQRHKAFLTL